MWTPFYVSLYIHARGADACDDGAVTVTPATNPLASFCAASAPFAFASAAAFAAASLVRPHLSKFSSNPSRSRSSGAIKLLRRMSSVSRFARAAAGGRREGTVLLHAAGEVRLGLLPAADVLPVLVPEASEELRREGAARRVVVQREAALLGGHQLQRGGDVPGHPWRWARAASGKRQAASSSSRPQVRDVVREEEGVVH